MAWLIVSSYKYWFESRKFNFVLQGEGRMRWAGGDVSRYQLSWSAVWGERSSEAHSGAEGSSVRPRKPGDAGSFSSCVLNVPETRSGHGEGRLRASLDCPFSGFIFTSWVHLEWKVEGPQRPFPLRASNSLQLALEESRLKKHSPAAEHRDPSTTHVAWATALGPRHRPRTWDKKCHSFSHDRLFLKLFLIVTLKKNEQVHL